jgi:hypothetical protein
MNCEEKMEKVWGPVLAHESGHALMALVHGITCHGIFAEKEDLRFCAIYGSYPPGRSKNDYLVSAAGVAGELVMYPNQESAGGGADRAFFNSPDAPPFEETVQEAREILSGLKSKLEALTSKLKEKIRSVNCDLDLLPDVGMDGSPERFLILLGDEELNAIVSPDGG